MVRTRWRNTSHQWASIYMGRMADAQTLQHDSPAGWKRGAALVRDGLDRRRAVSEISGPAMESTGGRHGAGFGGFLGSRRSPRPRPPGAEASRRDRLD